MLNRYPKVKLSSPLLLKLLQAQPSKPYAKSGMGHPKLPAVLKKMLKVKLFKSYLSSTSPSPYTQNLRTRRVSRKLSVRKKPYMFLGLKKLPTVLRNTVFKSVWKHFRAHSRRVVRGSAANISHPKLYSRSHLTDPLNTKLKQKLKIV